MIAKKCILYFLCIFYEFHLQTMIFMRQIRIHEVATDIWKSLKELQTCCQIHRLKWHYNKNSSAFRGADRPKASCWSLCVNAVHVQDYWAWDYNISDTLAAKTTERENLRIQFKTQNNDSENPSSWIIAGARTMMWVENPSCPRCYMPRFPCHSQRGSRSMGVKGFKEAGRIC